ncbi:hypothetical protein BO82DRAFT_133159 [Aspergillus uvarum CBS 121591]|uniref:Uncharacterized protein n=1 Tax=Aspergillus uvarum CBS 121591 TaxID=1448315 RepID=A0A319DJ26_9EURO|nr:hypothetical protein BO82DRAFT_133159 [Aspergillus uvarum CBS 121591]PYH79432.1 hypothetical protein BO82DRAFT_133159 [Aspergillus uvarum CBS 121591]
MISALGIILVPSPSLSRCSDLFGVSNGIMLGKRRCEKKKKDTAVDRHHPPSRDTYGTVDHHHHVTHRA